MEAVTSGNEDVSDKTSAARHLELIYEEVSLEDSATDGNR
jgi:hypothetical protein